MAREDLLQHGGMDHRFERSMGNRRAELRTDGCRQAVNTRRPGRARPPRNAIPPRLPPLARSCGLTAGRVVLFVDDDRAILDGFRRILNGVPFRMLFAGSTAEALDVLEKEKVDVVVADDRMPGTSGLQLLTLLRRTRPAIHRILLTGEATLECAAQATRMAEVFAFLTKPCHRAVLQNMILEALSAQAWDEW